MSKQTNLSAPLRNLNANSRKMQKRIPRRYRAPHDLQGMEQRRLMSASIAALNGVLTVNGTDSADTITVDAVSPVFTTRVASTASTAMVASAAKVASAINFGGISGTVGAILFPVFHVKITDANGVVLTDASNQSLDRNITQKGITRINVNAGDGADKVTSNASVITVVNAGGGNDIVSTGAGADQLNGGDGNDQLNGNGGDDDIYGGNGADILTGGAGSNRMYGEAGTDGIYGGPANDYLNGGDDNDFIDAGSGNDIVEGGNGNDNVFGDDGYDLMLGEAGNDSLTGNNGDDYLDGGDGNDVVDGGAGLDDMIGGAGNDQLNGGSGDDSMVGGAGNDQLRGGTGNDILRGGDGNDDLYGEGDNDKLFGDAGTDGLYGGDGVDQLTGGTGSDRFLLEKDTPITFLGFTIGMKSNDNINDFGTGDVRVNFEESGDHTVGLAGQNTDAHFAAGNWAQDEIRQVDQALGFMHRFLNNSKLLRTSGGDELIFTRIGKQLAPDPSVFNVGGLNGGGNISLPDVIFNGSGGKSVEEIVFHEVGHNWDEENGHFSQWKSISGWTDSNPHDSVHFEQGLDQDHAWWHLKSAAFVSGYAETNPDEDFAEHFSAFFMNKAGLTFSGSPITTTLQKQAFISGFVSTLA